MILIRIKKDLYTKNYIVQFHHIFDFSLPDSPSIAVRELRSRCHIGRVARTTPIRQVHLGTFVSPVGRLDLDTSGLLLMTNDNQFAERVTNPDSHVPKTYLVKANGTLTRICRNNPSTSGIGSRLGVSQAAAQSGPNLPLRCDAR